MSVTLKLIRKAPVMEVQHRGTFDALVDAKGAGSIESDGGTIETPVAPGRHTLKVRDGRFSSRELSFEVTDGQDVSFRCHGRRIPPIWLASFVVPRWAQTPTGVAGAPRIERFPSHSAARTPKGRSRASGSRSSTSWEPSQQLSPPAPISAAGRPGGCPYRAVPRQATVASTRFHPVPLGGAGHRDIGVPDRDREQGAGCIRWSSAAQSGSPKTGARLRTDG